MMNFLRKQMKWVMAVIVVAFLLSTFLMYEGGSTRRTPTVNADGTMSDYEVAQINGRSLMRSELERMVRNYLSNYGSRNAESLDMATVYKAVLDQAVLDSQLDKEVREKGISVSDAEAEQAMKIYADTYYATRETFYQVLAQSGIKIDDYKKTLARQMAVDKLLSDAIGEVEISEDKAVEFYDTMKNLIYSKPEGFMVHMADFNTSADAEGFRTRLVNGESWDVIASKDDIPSKDIINITKAPVFLPKSALTMGTLNILASLDIMQPSPVFSVSSLDYAVGLKTSHVDETLTPYAEVSADIRAMLKQQEQRKRLNDYETELRGKAQLVINDQSLFISQKPQSAEITPEVKAESKPESADVVEVEEVKEVKSEDTEVKAEVKAEIKSPEITVEEVEAEEVKTEVKSEDVKVETVETVETETVKSEDAEPETKVEEVKEAETEAEEVKEVKSADVVEVKTEVKAENTEEVKEPEEVEVKEAETVLTSSEPEPKVETKSESEDIKAEEIKVEEVQEVQSEDTEVKAEVKTEVESPEITVEEVKSEDVKSEVKSEEPVPPEKPVVVSEEIKEEIKEVIQEAIKKELKEVENIETGTQTEQQN